MLARIYLGQITNWNDPAIKASNKGVNLPNLKITPIFRSDGSGDTYAFTNYLSDVSGAFKGRVGFSTSVSFPAGVGQKGNSGVTAALQSANGGIASAHRRPAQEREDRLPDLAGAQSPRQAASSSALQAMPALNSAGVNCCWSVLIATTGSLPAFSPLSAERSAVSSELVASTASR